MQRRGVRVIQKWRKDAKGSKRGGGRVRRERMRPGQTVMVRLNGPIGPTRRAPSSNPIPAHITSQGQTSTLENKEEIPTGHCEAATPIITATIVPASPVLLALVLPEVNVA